MRSLYELLKEFDGKTTIQQEEYLKTVLGVDVRVLGEISDIDSEHINLVVPGEKSSGGPLALALPYGTVIFIRHASSQVGNRLLEYAAGDEVQLTTRLMEGRFAAYSAYYTFDLVSISKGTSREERQNAARIEAERREAEKKRGCFVATAAYDVGDPSVILLKEFRDHVLNRTAVGRGAVRFYYLASPALARFIGASDRRRSRARVILRPFVLFASRQLASRRRRDA